MLADRRRKLLALHYSDQISADLFAEEEQRLAHQIAAAQEEVAIVAEQSASDVSVADQFEAVLTTLRVSISSASGKQRRSSSAEC